MLQRAQADLANALGLTAPAGDTDLFSLLLSLPKGKKQLVAAVPLLPPPIMQAAVRIGILLLPHVVVRDSARRLVAADTRVC